MELLVFLFLVPLLIGTAMFVLGDLLLWLVAEVIIPIWKAMTK